MLNHVERQNSALQNFITNARANILNEQIVQDILVVFGFILLVFVIGLLLEANLQDKGRNESKTTKNTVFISLIVLGLVLMLFGIYVWFRKHKRSSAETSENNQNVSKSSS